MKSPPSKPPQGAPAPGSAVGTPSSVENVLHFKWPPPQKAAAPEAESSDEVPNRFTHQGEEEEPDWSPLSFASGSQGQGSPDGSARGGHTASNKGNSDKDNSDHSDNSDNSDYSNDSQGSNHKLGPPFARAVICGEGMVYSLASKEQTSEAIQWALTADLDVGATLPPPLLGAAMETLMQQWSCTPANHAKRRRGQGSATTDLTGANTTTSRAVLKGRFKAWSRLVFGDMLILQSIVLTGRYSTGHLARVGQAQRGMQQQATYIKVVGIERTATGKSQQENRKWLRWVENQLLARGVNISRASSSATASAPAACQNCSGEATHACKICKQALCQRCCRSDRCLNTGQCSNFIDPPSTKGKGKGKGKGKSNRELLSEYQRLAEAVTLYVDRTGRGRRPDGTWGTSALAARGAVWQTAPENEPTGQCHRCGWWSTSTLWRCSYCHQELCFWCSSWDGGVCHCGRSCGSTRHQ